MTSEAPLEFKSNKKQQSDETPPENTNPEDPSMKKKRKRSRKKKQPTNVVLTPPPSSITASSSPRLSNGTPEEPVVDNYDAQLEALLAKAEKTVESVSAEQPTSLRKRKVKTVKKQGNIIIDQSQVYKEIMTKSDQYQSAKELKRLKFGGRGDRVDPTARFKANQYRYLNK